MDRWHRTAVGWTCRAMVGAGSLRWQRFATAGGRIVTPVAGRGRIAGGIGPLITRGAGRRFITGAGVTIQDTVGSGVRTGYGHRGGSAGVSRELIAAGPPYPRVPVFLRKQDGASKERP